MTLSVTVKLAILICVSSATLCAAAGSNAAFNATSGIDTLARLSGNYSDWGTDVDQDGVYDFLTVQVGVDVATPGEYSVVGYLYSPDGQEVAWSVDHEMLMSGRQEMLLQFDGRSIGSYGINGTYMLSNVSLLYGSSDAGMLICDKVDDAYRTSSYRFADFSSLAPKGKVISGSGSGEILLTISIEKTLPVFSGKYSFDLVGINIPPISSRFSVSGSKNGYAYNMEGINMPDKPNDIIITATGVKDVNVGLKKLQPAKSSNVWENNTWDSGTKTRTWVSTQTIADKSGMAVTQSDLISPGNYHVKIFGDAADNASQVSLTMTMIKKLFLNGKFDLSINTSGFPEGDYSIDAKALNGSLSLDEVSIGGFSLGG